MFGIKDTLAEYVTENLRASDAWDYWSPCKWSGEISKLGVCAGTETGDFHLFAISTDYSLLYTHFLSHDQWWVENFQGAPQTSDFAMLNSRDGNNFEAFLIRKSDGAVLGNRLVGSQWGSWELVGDPGIGAVKIYTVQKVTYYGDVVIIDRNGECWVYELSLPEWERQWTNVGRVSSLGSPIVALSTLFTGNKNSPYPSQDPLQMSMIAAVLADGRLMVSSSQSPERSWNGWSDYTVRAGLRVVAATLNHTDGIFELIALGTDGLPYRWYAPDGKQWKGPSLF